MTTIKQAKPIETIILDRSNNTEHTQDKEIKTNLIKNTTKTKEGVLLALIKKFKTDAENNITYTPFELKVLFQEVYNKFKSNRKRIVEIELENWKGTGKIDIYKGFQEDFIIIETIKDKESKQVKQTRHEISKVNVNRLLFIIKNWEVNESHSCYEVAEMLGFEWKELWKQRVKYYFPLYYYPLKCLEVMKLIKYSGRGEVTKLK